MYTNAMVLRVGDSPDNEANLVNRFDLHLNDSFMGFLAQENISMAFTTYEAGKLIIVGPGQASAVVTERNFERCMALKVMDDNNIYISTNHYILKLENALKPKQLWNGQWDRMYLPRSACFTGGVDLHEIVQPKDGHLYGVITGHNCIARIDPDAYGSFSPYWRPPFIDAIVPEDRCHLNGLCLDENNEMAYVSMVSNTNIAGEWKKHRDDGGLIMDIRNNEILASGLCMPHTPRLRDGVLWFLEAGKGYVCTLDLDTGKVERVLWRPGFLRGLHFYKHYALICCSAPRDETFNGLPLEEELKNRNQSPRCALDVIDLNTMELVHSVHITGHVKEIYDVAVIENCRQPLLHGFFGEEIKKIIVYGEDLTA